jgi:hypothetical protein
VAAHAGQAGVAQRLLAAKADPTIASNDGTTALSLAADEYIAAVLNGKGSLTISQSFNDVDQSSPIRGKSMLSNLSSLSISELDNTPSAINGGHIPSVVSFNELDQYAQKANLPSVLSFNDLDRQAGGHLPSSLSGVGLDQLVEADPDDFEEL